MRDLSISWSLSSYGNAAGSIPHPHLKDIMITSGTKRLGLIALALATISLGLSAPAHADGETGIVGHLTDSGRPVESATVTASAAAGDGWGTAVTDATGRYEIADLPPGAYRVHFDVAGHPGQYAYRQTSWSQASRITVTAGAMTAVNDSLLPIGTVQGRFTDQDGTGIPGTEVLLQRSPGHAYATYTDESGDYRLDAVVSGTYSVRFTHDELGIQQYAYGQVDPAEAALITVSEGATSTVNDARLPTGSVRVTVTDAVTGAPVPEFSASAGAASAEGVNGSALIGNVPIGSQQVRAHARGYLSSEPTRVLVSEGATTEVAVALVPSAQIRATVVDARTGEPVEGICVRPVDPTTLSIPDGCPASDASGTVILKDGLSAGSYKLFAYDTPWEEPRSPYGAQWVGSRGGTGDPDEAAVITAVAGQTVNAPTIKVDRRGTITGTVTGAGGSAVTRASVDFGNLHYHSGHGVLSFPVAADGTYTVDFLGPYRWTLHFYADGYAPQWSGNAGSREQAREIKVKADRTVRYDIRLVKGTKVRVLATEPGWFAAYDAATGEHSGGCVGWGSTGCDLLVLGVQKVKFKVWTEPADWWFGGADFASATPVKIPKTGTKTVTITR